MVAMVELLLAQVPPRTVDANVVVPPEIQICEEPDELEIVPAEVGHIQVIFI
jgi:hypothetical protein